MGIKITVSKPKFTSYSVSGKTLKEVWANIAKRGPTDPNDKKKVAALTTTSINIGDKWVPEMRSGQCLSNGKIETRIGIKNMSMTVESTIKMPKLGTNSLSKRAKKEWDRFIGKLDKHEREHQDVTAKVAKTVGDEIMKIEGIGLGDDEKNAIKAGKADYLKRFSATYSSKSLSTRITEASKKFDKSSKHGAKHGAVLNTDIT